MRMPRQLQVYLLGNGLIQGIGLVIHQNYGAASVHLRHKLVEAFSPEAFQAELAKMSEEKIKSALILDFDLHFGDGTSNTFTGSSSVSYFHPEATHRNEFLEEVKRCLETKRPYDIIAVSAGFDRHEEDWGGLLKTEDYYTVGDWAKETSLAHCQGRRFGVLEGGYNHSVLGRNVTSFLQGFRD